MIRPRYVQAASGETRSLWDSFSEAFSLLQTKNPILNGVYVETSVGIADTEIAHGLGKAPTGWFIVNRDANAVVWESSTVNSRTKDRLILVASAAVNVTLYVF